MARRARAAKRRGPRKLILVVIAALVASAAETGAGEDERLVPPDPSALPSSESGRPTLKSAVPIERDTDAVRVAPAVPFIDLPWQSFGKDYRGTIDAANSLRGFTDSLPMSGSSPDQFRLGNGQIGIQTKTALDGLERFRRSDCTTDDECRDSSPLPKSPARKGLKNLRKPFFGLSITTPLQ
jgi:hypothetical protein